MLQLIRKLKEHSAVRYIAVGGSSFVIELSVLFGLVHVGASRELATAIAYWIGLFLAFFLQKFVAFRDYRREVKALTKQGVFFATLTVWNWLFTVSVVAFFPASWLFVSRIVAQVIFSCWNYVIYKKIIFAQKEPHEKHHS